jgi:hypothetical protein
MNERDVRGQGKAVKRRPQDVLTHSAVSAVDVLDADVHAILRSFEAGNVAESEPERPEASAGFADTLDE